MPSSFSVLCIDTATRPMPTAFPTLNSLLARSCRWLLLQNVALPRGLSSLQFQCSRVHCLRVDSFPTMRVRQNSGLFS